MAAASPEPTTEALADEFKNMKLEEKKVIHSHLSVC